MQIPKWLEGLRPGFYDSEFIDLKSGLKVVPDFGDERTEPGFCIYAKTSVWVRLVCGQLGKMPRFHYYSEASDGMEQHFDFAAEEEHRQ